MYKVISCLTFLIIISFTAASPVMAEDERQEQAKHAIVKFIKKANGWVALLDNGALVALEIEEAQAMGLSPTATANKIVLAVAQEYWVTIKEVGAAGHYIGSDYIVPATTKTYEVIRDTGLPLLTESYEYTRDTIIPTASETATDLYEKAKPQAVEAYNTTKSYIADTGKWLLDKF